MPKHSSLIRVMLQALASQGQAFHSTVTHALPGSHPTRRRFYSTSAPNAAKLSWSDLYAASKLSHWSGLCYKPESAIPDLVKAEGLHLVAQGKTKYTSWIVADGCLDFGPFAENLLTTIAPSQQETCREALLRTVQCTIQATQGDTGVKNGASSIIATISASNTRSNNTCSTFSTSSSSSRTLQPQTSISTNHTENNLPSSQSRPTHTLNNVQPLQVHPTHPTLGSSASSSSSSSSVCWRSPRQRFVFVRGIQWSAPNSQFSQLASSLANFLPTPFAGPGSSNEADSMLVAHRGVSKLALDLYTHLLPHLSAPTMEAPSNNSSKSRRMDSNTAELNRNSNSKTGSSIDDMTSQDTAASDVTQGPLPLSFAGHSLGGALCMLLLALHRTQNTAKAPAKALPSAAGPAFKQRFIPGQELALPHEPIKQHQQQLTATAAAAGASAVHTFGSPPVIAHKDGGGGYKVLQALGLPDSAIRSFVQQHDPIPRVLLTADPTYHAMIRFLPGIEQVLQLRGWLLGGASATSSGDTEDARGTAAVLTPNRFIFENVGSVYLIKGGSDIVPMGSPADIEDWAEAQTTTGAYLLAQPARALKGWLDHHHSSYQHDLEIAALVELKREVRALLKYSP